MLKFKNRRRLSLWLFACSAGYALAFGTAFSTALATYELDGWSNVVSSLGLPLFVGGVVGALFPTLVLRVHSPFLRGRSFWLTLLLSGVLSFPGMIGGITYDFTDGFVGVWLLFVTWQAGMLMWYTSRA